MRRWRIFILAFLITCLVIHTDRKRAEAIVPLAFAAAAPYVLSALVGGTAAVWCYTHGGKEAWIKLHGAMLDGAAVTKQWVQEQIAELHGIDTNADPVLGTKASFLADPEAFYQAMTVNNYYAYNSIHSVKCTQKTSSFWYHSPTAYPFNPTINESVYSGNVFVSSINYNRSVPSGDGYDIYTIELRFTFAPYVTTPVSPSFNPEDYPELYSGPALLSNCHAVAKKFPDLVLSYSDWSPTEPETPADPVYVPPVYIVATLPDGRTVDSKGNIHPPLPGQPWTWPGATAPPSAVPGAVGELPVQQPDGSISPVAVPQPLIDKLRAAGLPENAVITSATSSTVTWRDTTTNATQFMPIPADLAAELPKALTQAEGPSAGEVETGDVVVPPLPEAGEFASDFEYDDPSDWNWSEWMNNPFQSVIDSMKIETSSATSVIHFPVNLGFYQFTVSADFAQYAGTFQTIGGFMVIMSGFMAIMLVIKK